jgi:hypothetical protein
MEMLPENLSRKAKRETWKMMAERDKGVNAQERILDDNGGVEG